MHTAVYYYTRSGNTEKLARAIAGALGVEARRTDRPLEERAELLFLGSSTYAGSCDPAIRAFLENNAGRVGRVVLFGSSAMGRSTLPKVKEIAGRLGVELSDECFHCPGRFLFLHRGRPSQDDLKAAAAFARRVAAGMTEQKSR